MIKTIKRQRMEGRENPVTDEMLKSFLSSSKYIRNVIQKNGLLDKFGIDKDFFAKNNCNNYTPRRVIDRFKKEHFNSVVIDGCVWSYHELPDHVIADAAYMTEIYRYLNQNKPEPKNYETCLEFINNNYKETKPKDSIVNFTILSYLYNNMEFNERYYCFKKQLFKDHWFNILPIDAKIALCDTYNDACEALISFDKILDFDKDVYKIVRTSKFLLLTKMIYRLTAKYEGPAEGYEDEFGYTPDGDWIGFKEEAVEEMITE